MIILTGLNGTPFVLNCTLIETMYEIPETKISLTNGKYYLVKESQEEVIQKIIDYNRNIFKDAIRIAK
ncbi:flagellar FlbD family protein [Paludicola sp. MB14-C6]|uniref:flagellar FlbD family protein n=1 Tax=Paludihabitans sp. MB14-C6 TaxID=3070656 RepID=UPI0027DDE8E6|nr:flagellar FlbD family protein [Paludicola sp. MB14-C6]WMJ24242.1 flagellar FlbD family protein [Paludicola sp. MB14-C6]